MISHNKNSPLNLLKRFIDEEGDNYYTYFKNEFANEMERQKRDTELVKFQQSIVIAITKRMSKANKNKNEVKIEFNADIPEMDNKSFWSAFQLLNIYNSTTRRNIPNSINMLKDMSGLIKSMDFRDKDDKLNDLEQQIMEITAIMNDNAVSEE